MVDDVMSRPGDGPWRAGTVEGFLKFPDQVMEGSIPTRFFDVASTFADKTALSSPAGSWSYVELADRVTRTAGGLVDRLGGSSPEPVGILATHDGPLVMMILAVMAAGHIVVVFDPTVPDDAQDHLVRESGMRLLIHDDDHRELASAVAGRHDMDAVHHADLDMAEVELPVRGPTDPAMLAFTSGTSGSSKAGIISHGVILNVVRGATNALGVTPDDRMPMLFPVSLAVASYPMFIPLLTGGTLATLDVRGQGLAPVADFLVDERITLAYMAPTVIRFLVDAVAGYEFPDLRMIALGGEMVGPDVVALANDLFAPEQLANGFGTTETGVITLYVIDPDEPFGDAVPGGYPVEEVDLLVLDDDGTPVEQGLSGEIAVASPHLFSGYWGHDELNSEVLSPDPSGRDGWRLYRTGDLGRLDEHGALIVMGRVDTKVKIRGRFVVLGDVEEAVQGLEQVADAAVIPIERDGNLELRAIAVLNTDEPVDSSELRAELLEHHPAFQVPSQWVITDEMPRLPNGKVDRRALAHLGWEAETSPSDDGRPDGSAQSGAVDAVPADHEDTGVPVAAVGDSAGSTAGSSAGTNGEINTIQRQLRDIWELLLPVEEVALDDDFTHLGGDSLLAAQMLVMAEQRIGTAVPMGELVNTRTIRQLAEVIQRIREQTGTTTVSCVQEGDEASRPRLWFIHDLQGSAYRVRHVARELGADQPVWSFESPILAGEPNPFTSLTTFAANYVTDLLKVQPEGPYWLSGYSFGGVCAYEMARQLVRDGHEIAFVGVVDVGPGYRGPGWSSHFSPVRPWFGIPKPPEEGSSLAERVAHYRRMFEHSPLMTARHLTVRTGLSRVIDPIRFRADLRRHGRVRPEWRLWYAWEEHWRLATGAWDRSNTYDGRVDLFWASESASADGSMGWEPLVGELHVHRFSGDHLGALEPRGAAALAKVLRRVVDERIAAR